VTLSRWLSFSELPALLYTEDHSRKFIIGNDELGNLNLVINNNPSIKSDYI
jgi:hypothetical protein